jgi:hypothetical protein
MITTSCGLPKNSVPQFVAFFAGELLASPGMAAGEKIASATNFLYRRSRRKFCVDKRVIILV